MGDFGTDSGTELDRVQCSERWAKQSKVRMGKYRWQGGSTKQGNEWSNLTLRIAWRRDVSAPAGRDPLVRLSDPYEPVRGR